MGEILRIPLRRVRLPTAHAITPYIGLIDENAWYSNRGPLVRAFEERLANHFEVPFNAVTLTSSGTSGLSACLHALRIPTGKVCITPPLTFAASPMAARAAGLQPFFADIDPETLMLTPDSIKPALEAIGLERVGAVMPVSLYGATVDVSAWRKFRETTGIPVVIDAAWCFDRLSAGDIPAVVSLHATKVMGIGEGGAIVCRDTDFIEQVWYASNFAFEKSRESGFVSTNAKMSEYGAAVGLACMDEWPKRRKAAIHVAECYTSALLRKNWASVANEVDGTWAAATILLKLTRPCASEVTAALADHEIEVRHWWGGLCSTHNANKNVEKVNLPHAEEVLPHLINLPYFDELEPTDINKIIELVGTSAG